MALTYGFYNSVNHDRRYYSTQFSNIVNAMITDGVFLTRGNAFAVTPAANGLGVNVDTGFAWFNSTWTENDQLLPLTLTAADVSRPRIDAIVLDVNGNDDVRENDIIVVTGAPYSTPTKPALINEGKHTQHALAYVTVNANATSILAENIEIVVGQNETPYADAKLSGIDITALFQQWQGEFETWFADIQSQLEGDVATNLLNKINALEQNKLDKVADRATAEDLTLGAPDKWVSAGMLREESLPVGSIIKLMPSIVLECINQGRYYNVADVSGLYANRNELLSSIGVFRLRVSSRTIRLQQISITANTVINEWNYDKLMNSDTNYTYTLKYSFIAGEDALVFVIGENVGGSTFSKNIIVYIPSLTKPDSFKDYSTTEGVGEFSRPQENIVLIDNDICTVVSDILTNPKGYADASNDTETYITVLFSVFDFSSDVYRHTNIIHKIRIALTTGKTSNSNVALHMSLHKMNYYKRSYDIAVLFTASSTSEKGPVLYGFLADRIPLDNLKTGDILYEVIGKRLSESYSIQKLYLHITGPRGFIYSPEISSQILGDTDYNHSSSAIGDMNDYLNVQLTSYYSRNSLHYTYTDYHKIINLDSLSAVDATIGVSDTNIQTPYYRLYHQSYSNISSTILMSNANAIVLPRTNRSTNSSHFYFISDDMIFSPIIQIPVNGIPELIIQ